MAVYTVYPTALTGDSKAYVTPASGDTFPNDGRTVLHVKNANAGTCTVTVTATKPCDVAGTLHTNVVVVAATTGDEMIGPFPVGVWGGTVTVTTYSVTASVTVAAISVP
jgi:hypothetical protein